jgi:hypothetical protein
MDRSIHFGAGTHVPEFGRQKDEMRVRNEATMKPTAARVVLADMSRLTRDLIVRIVETEPGVEVVAEVPDHAISLRPVVAQTAADIVILDVDASGLLAECIELLDELALRRVLAVSADGRQAHVFGVNPGDSQVGELSPALILDVVRRSEILETAGSTAQGGLE